MKPASWDEFFSKLDEITFEPFDLIVAIGSGGIIPAGFIQQKLKIPMKILWINYRDEKNIPKYEDAMLLENDALNVKDKKVLIVDDVCRSGKTLAKAKEALKGNTIRTFIVNGNADYSLFNSSECILIV
jgi:hypoxanthine phosphoribosyltransferase